ncbi:STAS domain-containing protein [Actinomadura nitritigenes]|uniref:STAS domain-containing protein n=1 Tax=Actinomadura nitritigenes TaxID=134602 RepID=UPI003D8D9EC1
MNVVIGELRSPGTLRRPGMQAMSGTESCGSGSGGGDVKGGRDLLGQNIAAQDRRLGQGLLRGEPGSSGRYDEKQDRLRAPAGDCERTPGDFAGRCPRAGAVARNVEVKRAIASRVRPSTLRRLRSPADPHRDRSDTLNTSYTSEGHTGTHPQVVLSVVRRSTYTVAALQGDLDMLTAPALRDRLLELLHSGQRILVLDLSHLWFDAAGISVLISAWHRALALGVSMRLAAPRSHVAKTLDAALEHGLATYPTVARALKQPIPQALEPAGV